MGSRRVRVVIVLLCLVVGVMGVALYNVSTELDSVRKSVYAEGLGRLGAALRFVAGCLGSVAYGVKYLGEANADEVVVYVSLNLRHAQNYLYFARIPAVGRGDPYYDVLLKTSLLVSDLDALLGVLANKAVENKTYIISFLRAHLDSVEELAETVKRVSIAYTELFQRKNVDARELVDNVAKARRIVAQLLNELS